MSALAPTLQAFFTDRLVGQRQASPHTVAAYRDTMRLLVRFAAARRDVEPSRLDIADLDAPLISAFLDHCEHDRGNSVRTRNARLAAIRSLFRYAALCHPEHAPVIERVLAIPPKRFERRLVTFLTEPEVAALLAAPDRATWTGRRDHALLALAVQTVLRASLAERAADARDPLFSTRSGRMLSRDALEHRLAASVAMAGRVCLSLREKTITLHVLRHTAAMRLLHAGVDTAVIALWLGHEQVETTQIYLHADLALKERALARTTPAHTRPGRYRPPDATLAFLEAL